MNLVMDRMRREDIREFLYYRWNKTKKNMIFLKMKLFGIKKKIFFVGKFNQVIKC